MVAGSDKINAMWVEQRISEGESSCAHLLLVVPLVHTLLVQMCMQDRCEHLRRSVTLEAASHFLCIISMYERVECMSELNRGFDRQ